MHLNILAIAVPFFLFFMGIEFLLARKRNQGIYKFGSSVANISIGIFERACDVFVALFFYSVYDHIQKNYGLFEIRASVPWWILLLLLTDLAWYWYHRLAHEINLFWAVHIVHHQSEEFNYTASARITLLQAFLRTCFWSVLPLVGFPAGMITGLLIVHGIYPFFVHTRLVGRLGILEYILVTPSHHRVHHASDEKYLDKNYGDVFIIWDKLFGTFCREEEEPTYGITHQLKSFSFLWQHFHYFIELGLAMRDAKGFVQKVRILFGRPDRVAPVYRQQAERIFKIRQATEPENVRLNNYVIYQLAILCTLLFGFILFEHYLDPVFEYGFMAVLVLTLINCGAILEQKKWVYEIEIARASVLLIAGILTYRHYNVTIGYSLLAFSILLVYYRDLREKYLRQVYPGTVSVVPAAS